MDLVRREIHGAQHFLGGQYFKAIRRQKIFIWFSLFSCLFVIAVGMVPIILQHRGQLDDAAIDGRGKDVQPDERIVLARNILFGIAFSFFGTTSVFWDPGW